MLKKENLDILSVVTSDNRHTDIVVDAANVGIKGIVCEKPLATTVDDCNRMIAACETNGVPISIDHTRRWWPAYHRARKAIREGAIGGVRRIVAHMGGPRAMLFRNGTHLIDGTASLPNRNRSGYSQSWTKALKITSPIAAMADVALLATPAAVDTSILRTGSAHL